MDLKIVSAINHDGVNVYAAWPQYYGEISIKKIPTSRYFS